MNRSRESFLKYQDYQDILSQILYYKTEDCGK